MDNQPVNKPIFVVGSPRSGTSILTWCLGQHPNILPLEESNWMGELALDIGVRYEAGSARGERAQLASAGISRAEFFATFGRSINAMIAGHRVKLEENSRLSGQRDPSQIHEAFHLARNQADPKARWVDGTPEYSMYVCGLRKLFPDARFIHIVRDVESVVRSIMNFKCDGSKPLVGSTQEAYEYWLRTVRACVQAEQAWGRGIVHRIRYAEFMAEPEKVVRGVLEFLGEPYVAGCIEPLAKRINSSNVPEEFTAVNGSVAPEILEQARQLSEHLSHALPGCDPSIEVAQHMESEFDERVRFVASLDGRLLKANKALDDVNAQLVERSKWALSLDKELTAKDQRIVALQREFDERTAWALKMREELRVQAQQIETLRRQLDARQELSSQSRV